jgi:hypothetical protein
VDLDVALADLAGCRTDGIGTEYAVVRVLHGFLSGLDVGGILPGDPHPLFVSDHECEPRLSAHLPPQCLSTSIEDPSPSSAPRNPFYTR